MITFEKLIELYGMPCGVPQKIESGKISFTNVMIAICVIGITGYVIYQVSNRYTENESL
jgi:cytochrome b subunit of formate dehydrogenase